MKHWVLKANHFLVASLAPDPLAMFDIQATIRARLEAGPVPATHPAPSASARPGRSAPIPAVADKGKAPANSAEPEGSPRPFSEAGEESETPRPKAHPAPKKSTRGRGRGGFGRGRGRAKQHPDATTPAKKGKGGENGDPADEVAKPEVHEPGKAVCEEDVAKDDAALPLEVEPKPKPKNSKGTMKRPAASGKTAMKSESANGSGHASVGEGMEPETEEVDSGHKKPDSALKRPAVKSGPRPEAKAKLAKGETKKEVRVLKSGWKAGC